MFQRVLTVVALTLSLFAATGNADTLGNAQVKGQLYDRKVEFTSAKYDNNILELYEGDSWGQNQSILIFLFDKGKDIAPGKSIKVISKKHSMDPHLHSRFDTKNGIETEIAMSDYEMTIRFGKKIKKGYLPATFKLNLVEDKGKTKLEGFFFLRKSDLKQK